MIAFGKGQEALEKSTKLLGKSSLWERAGFACQ